MTLLLTAPAPAESTVAEAPLPLELRGHLPVLDGVRGLAVLLVLVHHFGIGGDMNYPRPMARLFFGVAMTGWSGVDLFFVLSGFLITGILYDSKGSEHYFRTFYVRRALRIFPLYYGALIVGFFLLPLLTGNPVGRPFSHLWLWCYATSLYPLFTGQMFDMANPVGLGFGHFWSLAVEEHFYLVWPLVVSLLGRRALMWTCGAVILAALVLRWALVAGGASPGFLPYYMTPCRMDSLAIGAWVALAARGPRGLTWMFRPAAALAAVSALLLAALLWFTQLDRERAVVAILGYPLMGLFFAAGIVLALRPRRGNWLNAALDTGALRFFGKYSYGIYVFHGLFLAWFHAGPFSVSRLHAWTGRYLVAIALYCIAATAITVAAAWLSYHVYEKQFLKLKRYFEYTPGRYWASGEARIMTSVIAVPVPEGSSCAGGMTQEANGCS